MHFLHLDFQKEFFWRQESEFRSNSAKLATKLVLEGSLSCKKDFSDFRVLDFDFYSGFCH